MPDFLDKFKANLERQKKRVAPPARKRRRLFDRCLLMHEGQQFLVDLKQAQTCPPGFIGLKGSRAKEEIPMVQVPTVKRRAPAKRKAPAKRAKKSAVKKVVAKKSTKKRAKKTNGNGSTPAAMRERIRKLYAARKLGEASKLRAKLRAMGHEYK